MGSEMCIRDRSVAPKASVSKLRMSLGEFSAPDIESVSSAIEFAISPTYETANENGEFICTVCFKLRAVTDDDERNETGLRVHANFDISISIDGEHEEDAIDAFIRLNSVFVTWSYLREFVQSCTSRMQLPALTLPLMTVNAIEQHLLQENDCDEDETKSSVIT